MYQIKNELDGNLELLIYDNIGVLGITASETVNQIRTSGCKKLTIRINSEGGDVFEALSIYNYIKSMEVPVDVYIDGLAASAASVIAMCGKVYMPSNAMMMIHNPWGLCQGDSEEMRDMASLLDKIRDSLVNVYKVKTGLTPKELREMMNSETWLNAKEAKSKGFVDEITDSVHDKANNAYESGVKAERERLKALDELMTPERQKIINRAKYEDIKTANEIAIEILKSEKPKQNMSEGFLNFMKDKQELNGVSSFAEAHGMKAQIEEAVRIMNRMRGYE